MRALQAVTGPAARAKFWRQANQISAVRKFGQKLHTVLVDRYDWTSRVTEERCMTLKISVSTFVPQADRFGHEASEYSSLASTLVIDAAVKACGRNGPTPKCQS